MGPPGRIHGYDPVPHSEDEVSTLKGPQVRILYGHRTYLAAFCGVFGLLTVVLALVSL